MDAFADLTVLKILVCSSPVLTFLTHWFLLKLFLLSFSTWDTFSLLKKIGKTGIGKLSCLMPFCLLQ